MASWLNLPGELVETIGELLDSYADFVRLRAVCPSWRSVLPNVPTQPLTPWLMLPFDDESDTRRPFFSLVDKKIYRLDLPETRKKLFHGSFNGWVITQDESSASLYLFNPLTRAQIGLPRVTSFPNVIAYDPHEHKYKLIRNDRIGPYYFFDRVVLTKVPSLGNNDDNAADYLAMAIHGPFSSVAFCRGGDKKWTAATPPKCYYDVTLHENKIYAIRGGWIEVSNLDSSLNFVETPVNFPPKETTEIRYLVSCGLGLLVVFRHHFQVNKKLKTKKFKVYRVDTNLHRYSVVKSLGDYMLFVGLNTAFAIPSRSGGLKGNCIYYTDDHIERHLEGRIGGHDFGVYNMNDGKTSKLEGYQERDLFLYWPSPIWVVPNAEINSWNITRCIS